jgi:hypothetical protein
MSMKARMGRWFWFWLLARDSPGVTDTTILGVQKQQIFREKVLVE